MDRDELEAFWTAEEPYRRRAQPWALDRTVGIGFVWPGGNYRPMGCGVLFKIAERAFVLSAGHVLECAKEATVILASMVPGHTAQLLVGNEITYRLDPEDIGIVALKREQADELERHGKKFLRRDDLDVDARTQEGRYFVSGHPLELIKVDHEIRHVRLDPMSHWTVPFRGTHPNETPGVSVTLEFRDSVAMRDGEEARMPHLGGISGCGVWRMYVGGRWDEVGPWNESRMKVVGIEHRTTPSAIMGTKISKVLKLIVEKYPDLRDSMSIVIA